MYPLSCCRFSRIAAFVAVSSLIISSVDAFGGAVGYDRGAHRSAGMDTSPARRLYAATGEKGEEVSRTSVTIISRREVINGSVKLFVASGAALLALICGKVTAPAWAESQNTQDTPLPEFLNGPRGLKYLVLQEGNPNKNTPIRGQKVRVRYTLYKGGFDGQEIDSSREQSFGRGLLGTDKPFEVNIGVGKVIKGWDLTLMDMREGEKRKVVVPPELAYGDGGFGKDISPGETLFFEIELSAIGRVPEYTPEQQKWLEQNPL